MFTIIAPHPDDELIGCYTLFSTGLVERVIIIPDANLDMSRIEETRNFCDYQGGIELVVEMNPSNIDTTNLQIIVPSLTDTHPYHRYINRLFYNVKKGIYSVDMQAEYVKELNNWQKENKHFVLDMFYPSQKELWDKDAKYYLFEGIVFELN